MEENIEREEYRREREISSGGELVGSSFELYRYRLRLGAGRQLVIMLSKPVLLEFKYANLPFMSWVAPTCGCVVTRSSKTGVSEGGKDGSLPFLSEQKGS